MRFTGHPATPHTLADAPRYWQTVLVFRLIRQKSKRLNTKKYVAGLQYEPKTKKREGIKRIKKLSRENIKIPFPKSNQVCVS